MTDMKRTLASSLLMFFSCVLLVLASIILYQGDSPDISIYGFIIATMGLTTSASINLYGAYIVNGNNKKHILTMKWMLLGATLFLAASVMYLSLWQGILIHNISITHLGTWTFRLGSCAYLVGSYRLMKDLGQNRLSIKNWTMNEITPFLGVISFMLGSLLYIAGGLIGHSNQGGLISVTDLWILGSCCFMFGSMVSI